MITTFKNSIHQYGNWLVGLKKEKKRFGKKIIRHAKHKQIEQHIEWPSRFHLSAAVCTAGRLQLLQTGPVALHVLPLLLLHLLTPAPGLLCIPYCLHTKQLCSYYISSGTVSRLEINFCGACRHQTLDVSRDRPAGWDVHLLWAMWTR